MNTIIVSDLHGDIAGLRGILTQQGVLDQNGQRVPGWKVIQLGDFIHGGHHEMRDLQMMIDGIDLVDTCLLGNHELPHAFPQNHFPTFGGQTPLPRLAEDALRKAVFEGKFHPAIVVDNYLLTHAGVHPRLAREEGIPPDSQGALSKINERWKERIRGRNPDPLFDWIGGRRGGMDPMGGIFWCDWRDLYIDATWPVSQIVGHTPQNDGYAHISQDGIEQWCIDAGAALSWKVSALVKKDGEWTPIVYRRSK